MCVVATRVSVSEVVWTASIAGGLAFLRYESANPSAGTRSSRIRVAHLRIKIERVYRNYLTAWEACGDDLNIAPSGKRGHPA
jgi:hypothetical protein